MLPVRRQSETIPAQILTPEFDKVSGITTMFTFHTVRDHNRFEPQPRIHGMIDNPLMPPRKSGTELRREGASP